MNPITLRSAWRHLSCRRDGDALVMAYVIFVICFVLLAR